MDVPTYSSNAHDQRRGRRGKLTYILVVAGVVLLVGFGWLVYGTRHHPAKPPTHAIRHTVSPEFANIARTLQLLQEFRIPDEDQFIPVPEPVRPLLTTLKHQLRDLMIKKINRNPDAVTTGSVQQIWDDLNKQGLILKQTDTNLNERYSDSHTNCFYTYGEISSIAITKPPGHTNLLAFTTTLEVPFGDDTSLYLLQRKGAGWQLILQQEATDYKDISGAQWLFQFAVSPSDTNGQFFVVTTHVTPWPQSAWRCIRFRAMRPCGSPDQPRTLIEESGSYYLGDEDAKITFATSSGFMVEFDTHQSLEAGTTRKRVMAYQVDDYCAQRVAPPCAYAGRLPG